MAKQLVVATIYHHGTVSKADTLFLAYIDHIGGIENIGVKSGSFWPHTDICSLCKSHSSNLEDD